jgi:hypothetical protein
VGTGEKSRWILGCFRQVRRQAPLKERIACGVSGTLASGQEWKPKKYAQKQPEVSIQHKILIQVQAAPSHREQ